MQHELATCMYSEGSVSSFSDGNVIGAPPSCKTCTSKHCYGQKIESQIAPFAS
jgi:hypothetical protein